MKTDCYMHFEAVDRIERMSALNQLTEIVHEDYIFLKFAAPENRVKYSLE